MKYTRDVGRSQYGIYVVFFPIVKLVQWGSVQQNTNASYMEAVMLGLMEKEVIRNVCLQLNECNAQGS